MLLLHAALLDESVLLWAELSVPAGKAEATFAPHSALVAALTSIPSMVAVPASARAQRVAWLPAARGRVVLSSPLLAEDADVEPPDGLADRTVDVLAFETSNAFPFLQACEGRALLSPGHAVGRDVAFWASVARFAAGLVAGRRYVPTLEAFKRGRTTAYRARWRPRFGPSQRAELATLAAAMPAACRALARAGDPPPSADPQELVRRFVARGVDGLVRLAASRASAATARGDSPNDRWLAALCGEDDTFVLRGAAPFVAQVAEWVRETTREDDAEYRLCLRLEEPAGGETGWFVRYLLQAHADPSLLAPADDLWKNVVLRRAFLDALGRAARLSPHLDATLRAKKPAGYGVDDEGAHAFLTADAPRLQDAGIGVLLPAWWTPYGTRTRVVARAAVKRKTGPSSGMNLGAVLEVTWSVALAGEVLSTRELAELARLKAPLVKVRGQWVIVDQGELRAAIELRERSGATMTLGEIARMAVTGRAAATGLDVERVTGSGAVGKVLDRLAGRAAFEEQPAPSSLKGTLRPYQRRGYSWLHFHSQLGLGACLADDMGLGKTITTLALVARDWESDTSAPVLLVCPTSVIGNWQRELARFTPDLPVIVHHGGARARTGLLLPKKASAAIVLTSYGLLHRDVKRLGTVRWRGIVLDEAQNVKNADGKAAQAARALAAGYRVALTGTPIENHVGDLWSLMDFLNPGLLGGAASFRREFLIPIATRADAEAEARLKRMTGPFVLRRLKSDPAIVADLPKKLEMRVFCQLTREQASLYAAVLRDVHEQLEDVEGIQRRGLILATVTKLKQVCNHPTNLLRDNSALEGRSGKLSRLGEMLDEVQAAGERALVFTQFTEMAGIIQRYLQETTGREVLYLHGAIAKTSRDRMVERFQTAEDAPSVFLLSLRAGGTGLNLTRANHVFHFDRWWNPAVENQASDRAYRIGQTKNVHVHRLVCAGTIEDKIDSLLERKSAVANRLVRSGETGLTELSNEQLRDLFALGADAVVSA
ncbi:MAG: DEAD/DEAH box helicase [Candidatus Baltobacteraceae bacterium]